ncbi:DNA-processing protein DprA [Mailhella sp.]|uniref:DNA-processing protein DprA n=1 Tax=Mailhella sp. TaxID=1981029 RepID=UPI004062EC54
MSEHRPITPSAGLNAPEQQGPSVRLGLALLDDEGRREYWSSLALRCTPGLGQRSVCALLDCFGSAWEAVQNPHDWDDAGVGADKVRAFLSERWRSSARPEWEAARRFPGHIILWTDPRFPQRLKALDDAPSLLYALGDIALLDAPCVAVVGSRKASNAALDFVSRTAEELSRAGITVVSGMAFGIDARAHRAALHGAGRTIAVLAGGADVPYPSSHTELHGRIREQGLVVSECAPGSPAHAKTFPRRNRIISGLSLGVLIAEAEHEKSGSLITARLAAEQGRPVYVPAPDALRGTYREGTKSLLMQGAMPIWQAGDLMADLFPHLKHALSAMGREDTHKTPEAEAGNDALPERADACTAPRRPYQKAASEPALSHRPLEGLNDAVPENAYPAPARQAKPLLPEEAFLSALLCAQPLSPDDLLLAAQEQDDAWTAPRLLSTLMVMEVKKLVRRRPDSRYEVCP